MGISGTLGYLDQRNQQYYSALLRNGIFPPGLPLTSDMNILRELLAEVDGVMFCGTALSAEGYPEAMEHTEHPFAVGVQWYPERLDDAPTQKVFSLFREACLKQ